MWWTTTRCLFSITQFTLHLASVLSLNMDRAVVVDVKADYTTGMFVEEL